jgi:hypothetical protein
MRKTCVQPVDSPWVFWCVKLVGYTQPRTRTKVGRVQPAFVPRFLPTASPTYPHHQTSILHPLAHLFSPLSTGPITMTTKYIINK